MAENTWMCATDTRQMLAIRHSNVHYNIKLCGVISELPGKIHINQWLMDRSVSRDSLFGVTTVTQNSMTFCEKGCHSCRLSGIICGLSHPCFTCVGLFWKQQLIKSQESPFAPFLIWKHGVVSITWVKQPGPMSSGAHLTVCTPGSDQVHPGSESVPIKSKWNGLNRGKFFPPSFKYLWCRFNCFNK